LFRSSETIQTNLLFVFIFLFEDDLRYHLCIKYDLETLGDNIILFQNLFYVLVDILMREISFTDCQVKISFPSLPILTEFNVIPLEQCVQIINYLCEVIYFLVCID